MASISADYELELGPSHIPVDEYASQCDLRFQKLLNSEPEETEVQDYLEKNPWLVPGHSTPGAVSGHSPLHCALITHPKLPGQDLLVPDFMWIATHSGAWFPTLIEIEKPSKRIFTRRGTPSAQFTQARHQLNQWRSWFKDPTNQLQFLDYYGIPWYFRDRTMTLHMILIYGRRSEFEDQPKLINQLGTLLPGSDEELMSFDRLHADTTMMDSITITAIGHGKYRAKRILPVFCTGPELAHRLLSIAGFEEAVEVNPDISEARKLFLKRRIPYWKQWASSTGRKTYRPSDRE